MDQVKTIILAAGGTGGHIFPAHALAAELEKRGYKVHFLADQRYKNFVKDYDDKSTHFLMVSNPGKKTITRFIAAIKLVISILQSIILLKKIKPCLIIGFGGYPSFPGLLAARLLNVKAMIHEQNSVFGKTNKFFVDYVKKIATSFKVVSGVKEKFRDKVIFTGNPVRNEIIAISQLPYPSFEEVGYLKILIVGGSQGAGIFSEVVPAAIERFTPEERAKIKIVQQCRSEDIDVTKEYYKKLNVEAEIATFFADMADKLSKANLVISRSGASSVAELLVSSRPAILVPYPYSAHQHQLHNASVYASSGAGWIMPQDAFTDETLYQQLEKIYYDPQMLSKAVEKAKDCYSDAASRLADIVDKLCM